MNIREKILNTKDRRVTRLVHVDEYDEDVVLVMPSERRFLELQAKHNDGLPQHEYEALLLMEVVHEPMRDPEGNVQHDENGQPLAKKKVFEQADKEALCSDVHQFGGHLRKLKNQVSQFILAATKEIASGKSETALS